MEFKILYFPFPWDSNRRFPTDTKFTAYSVGSLVKIALVINFDNSNTYYTILYEFQVEVNISYYIHIHTFGTFFSQAEVFRYCSHVIVHPSQLASS